MEQSARLHQLAKESESKDVQDLAFIVQSHCEMVRELVAQFKVEFIKIEKEITELKNKSR